MPHAPRRASFARVVVLAALAVAGLAACRKKPPSQVPVHLGVGATHACAAMADGSLRCWGAADRGELGDGKVIAGRSVALPVQAAEAEKRAPSPKVLFAGGAASCAMSDTGKLACWGGAAILDRDGVLSGAVTAGRACIVDRVGHLACSEAGRAFDALPPVQAVAVSGSRTCALGVDGAVFFSGAIEEPLARVTGLRPATKVAVGPRHACVVIDDGTVSCWGENDHGQLGDGTTFARTTPSLVKGLEHIKHVALGAASSCALDVDGTVHCWGANAEHQLVDGTTQDRSEPHMIPGLFDVRELALGDAFGCAILGDKTARCWGANEAGQAGDGTREVRPVPVVVRFQ